MKTTAEGTAVDVPPPLPVGHHAPVTGQSSSHHSGGGAGGSRKRDHDDESAELEVLHRENELLRADNERLQSDIRVLESSYRELQHLFGEARGEVIRMQMQTSMQLLSANAHPSPKRYVPVRVSRTTVATGGGGQQQYVSPAVPLDSSPDSASTSAQMPTPTLVDPCAPSYQEQQPPQTHYHDSSSPPGGQSYNPHIHSYKPAGLYCTVCNIEVNSESVMQSHLQGEKHRKGLSRIQMLGAYPPTEAAPPYSRYYIPPSVQPSAYGRI